MKKQKDAACPAGSVSHGQNHCQQRRRMPGGFPGIRQEYHPTAVTAVRKIPLPWVGKPAQKHIEISVGRLRQQAAILPDVFVFSGNFVKVHTPALQMPQIEPLLSRDRMAKGVV
ncbi:MAG: hypothetical protein ACI3V0_08130 [Faecousia sp.]